MPGGTRFARSELWCLPVAIVWAARTRRDREQTSDRQIQPQRHGSRPRTADSGNDVPIRGISFPIWLRRACRRVHLRFGQANRPYSAPKPHPTFSAPYLAERRSHASLPTLARDFRIGEQRRQAPSRAEEDAPVLSLGGTRRARRRSQIGRAHV